MRIKLSEHTKGPWVATKTIVHFGNEGGIDLRNCPDPEANARLIAAAPDLLSALKDIYKRGYEMSQHEMVRKAIAKATGKE